MDGIWYEDCAIRDYLVLSSSWLYVDLSCHGYVVMHSLHKVYGENVLWAGRVRPSVCSHDSTREPLDHHGLG
jgi:hypothetical protein